MVIHGCPPFSLSIHIAGEALWEPPKTGYTKHTGALVLSSGEVVTDPLEGASYVMLIGCRDGFGRDRPLGNRDYTYV